MQRGLEHVPSIHGNQFIEAMLEYKVHTVKAVIMNDMINIGQTKQIGDEKLKDLLGMGGKAELLPQLFTELPFECELHVFFVNINAVV